jgi:hypothetical protein
MRQDCDMPEPDITALRSQIESLTDAQAIRALALVVDHEHLDVGDLEQAAPHLREALDDPALQDYAPTIATPSGDGDLARAALGYFADTGSSSADLVDEAIKVAIGPAERFDPCSIVVVGLVLALLQTEVKLERKPGEHWHLLLHKRPMRDSTLGQVLTTLFGYVTGRGN